jgi:ATP/ADP translocase
MSQEKPRATSLRKIATAAFVLGLVQGLGSVIRDCALTCHVGYRYAPIAFLIVAALSLPFVALQLKLQRRWGEEPYRIRSTLVIAVSLLAFRLMLVLLRGDAGPSGPSAVVSYVGFFVWVDVAFMLIGAQLFALIQGDEQETDRGLTYFAAAVYAGGLIGGALTGGVNRFFIEILHLPMDVARDHLMIPMAISLLLLIPIAAANSPAVAESSAQSAADEPIKSDSGGFSEALRVLGGDIGARQVTTAFVLAAASGICLESLFYWVLTLNAKGGSGFVQLLASLAIWMNGTSFVLAAGGSARIIRRLGIAASVLTVPACLLLGSGYLLVGAALTVMLAMRVLKDSLSGGLYEPASERMLVRLQGDRYGRQRPIFEVASRMGTGVGALVVLALTLYFDASLQTLVIVTIVMHFVWLVSLVPLARKIRRVAAHVTSPLHSTGGTNA